MSERLPRTVTRCRGLLSVLMARRLLILAMTVCVPAASAAGTGDPPPIPSEEDREQLISAHRAGIDPSRWEAPRRAVHDEYDVLHYDVTLHLDVGARVLTGTVQANLAAVEENLAEIVLDLYVPMIVDGVRVNGAPAGFDHVGGLLTVSLDGVYQPGQEFSVACDYHGTPSYTGAPFRWNTHGASVPMILSYSEPYGAPAWWVCKDDPKDKATFSIHVTAPDTLFTVSNGLLDSIVNHGDGTATCHWIHDYPMSPYLFSIATTNYESWTEVYTALDGLTTMDVDYYAYPEDLSDAQISWSRNAEMMEYYAGIFGEYPFLNEKYAIAEFQHSGAMEHQTATSMGWTWVNGTHSNDFVVAHELAHSWVGDMITMRVWSHAWTKEGFATYCEALYFQDKYGDGYYHAYMNGLNPLFYGQYQLYNITPPLHGAIYYKGAWVIHMLRHVIGDDAFFNGVRLYVEDQDLRYAVSDTEDLREAFETASGLDLAWFFDQWVYHPGYPQFAVSWESVPSGEGYDLTLHLTQVQASWPIFKMPMDLMVETDAGEERFMVWDSLEVQSFALHVEGRPERVVLDPDDWMILEVVFDTDVAEGSAGGAEWRLECRPNPFSQAAEVLLDLPERGPVRLEIFDPAGRWVRTLLEGEAGPGRVTTVWDGQAADGSRLPAGVYFQRLVAGDRQVTGRSILIR